MVLLRGSSEEVPAEVAGLTCEQVPWLCDPASRRVCRCWPCGVDDNNYFGPASDGLESFGRTNFGRTWREAAPPRGAASRQKPQNYLIISKILKIGMYMATIMLPTIAPRKAIMSGSISAVSDSVVASTSWS